MSKTIDSMVGNAYLYGREWISDKVNSHKTLETPFLVEIGYDEFPCLN